ncbi:M28 family metallopeptidase [Thalassotalea hakodatensis]|uniref:M28 family metallopeptidase n=1 Tax=Thalassotalea hakodatensis TaxID=3030492 RepID=UPI0025741093|nr:M28 family metallopeptidase [Thalassotalea hakodatensis]
MTIKINTMIAACILSYCTVSYANDDFNKAYQSFDEKEIKADIKILSSDAFEGREPSGVGETLTTEMLIERFKSLGLSPGNGDKYTQAVPMVSITSKPETSLNIADLRFEFPKNFVATSRKTQKKIQLKNSELVFVGYGINAPEYQWNDYKNVDVKGKTVVVLVNDPGFATQDPKLFEGNTMTYYGRWIYKYEEAARQGAAGAIIVHETKPASYGWNVIESSWTGAQYHLPAKEVNEPAIDVEMWISIEKAKALFAKAGKDFTEMKKYALTKNFKATPLNLTASIRLKNEIKSSTSNNVIATLKGSEHPEEHVLYMGHWDHLGSYVDNDGKKVIYNGAHDNATGTAGLMHIAKAYQALGKAPKRSITFAAVTAEEQGRLGSRYFANHPTIPLNQIVGLINMDSLDVTGKKKDVTVVGYGKSELESYLSEAAKRQGRTLTAELTPERGYYYRSDHFSLAKKGVPALSAGGGSVWFNDSEKQIGDRVKAEVAKCYHQACDEYNEAWGWQGLIAELQLFFETGYLLAETTEWPNWREGTEFKAYRDNMMK